MGGAAGLCNRCLRLMQHFSCPLLSELSHSDFCYLSHLSERWDFLQLAIKSKETYKLESKFVH